MQKIYKGLIEFLFKDLKLKKIKNLNEIDSMGEIGFIFKSTFNNHSQI